MEAREAAEAAERAAAAIAKAGKRLLSEEEEGHDEHGDEEVDGFPLPNVIFFIGFMLMLFLD